MIAMEKDDEPKQRSREEYKKERELEEVSDNKLEFSRPHFLVKRIWCLQRPGRHGNMGN